MTPQACVELLSMLTLDELIELQAWTRSARGDAQYLARVETWVRARERRQRKGAR